MASLPSVMSLGESSLLIGNTGFIVSVVFYVRAKTKKSETSVSFPVDSQV